MSKSHYIADFKDMYLSSLFASLNVVEASARLKVFGKGRRFNLATADEGRLTQGGSQAKGSVKLGSQKSSKTRARSQSVSLSLEDSLRLKEAYSQPSISQKVSK